MARLRTALLLLAVSSLTLTASAKPQPKELYSKGYTTWVYVEPQRSNRQLGYIRVGDSIALRAEAPVKGPGCADYYYPVEPMGWVCNDRTVSLALEGRYLQGMQLARYLPGLMPFHFALSNGTPMYARLPSPAEWRKEERFLGAAGTFKPLSYGNRGHELLAEQRTEPPRHSVPEFLREGGAIGTDQPLTLVRRQIPLGSMLAYTRSFEHEGRTFLLSADGTVVPADRVRPFRTSTFRGTTLGRDVSLPIAFFRAKARPKYRRTSSGSFEPSGQSWAVRSFVGLDPGAEPEGQGKAQYLRTLERQQDGTALYALANDATVVARRDKLPIGVAPGTKWLLISITQGTLVAYDGAEPAYATLMSPGAGGVPVRGQDPVKMSTTPMGVYRVTFKHRAATMSPEQGENRSFWIADVPYTQYFNAPFALHTAYWHENFGEPMSAGCINVSPEDGRYLFDWTDPKMPTGWNGAAPVGPLGPGTYVVISR